MLSLLLTGIDPGAELRAGFNCQTPVRQAIRAMLKKVDSLARIAGQRRITGKRRAPPTIHAN